MAGMIFSQGSGVADSVFGKSVEPIRALVEQGAEAFEQQSMIDKIYAMDTTQNFAEKYTSETALGAFEPVGEGGAYPKSEFREGYSQVITPDTWKNSFVVTQEMVEDAKMGKVKQKASAFNLSYGRTREDFAAGLLMGGFSGAVTMAGKQFSAKAADGKSLFATDHPSITGKGTQSNLYDADISYDTICYMEEKMQNFTDDDGNLLNLMPDTIIIPNRARAKKLVFDAVGADGIPNSANNSFNYMHDRWNIIVWPYLNKYLTGLTGLTSGKDPIIMMDSKFNEAYFGAVWLDRIKLTVKTTIDENTDDNVWSGRARYAAGFNNWRAFIGCFAGSSGSTF